ncbi:uncharacterized protein BDZ99DRAFT_467519 [Mytilinidion resinicola]|uniref:Uncharacterized protein n=1 Tax=Mytilinidion resinicola TaxID=574789 RepID=A0A6A6Y6S8_9PEZI|nr:uncharacterized protein BDZ99DRAFT_467519 [Mytilinidion resinicola]KAF2804512.1 hypothetical protein BDZ99DRAFT_467519 [Mytilinidion resinicola]
MTSSDSPCNGARCASAETCTHSSKTTSCSKQKLREPHTRQPPTCVGKPNVGPHYMRPTANSSVRRRAVKSSRLPSSSSGPPASSQSLFCCPLADAWPAHRSDITQTDPTYTKFLWRTIMDKKKSSNERAGREMGDTLSTKAKRRPRARAESTSASGSHSGKWPTPPTSETSSFKSKKDLAAKVTDVDFIETVLEPCGITIQNKGVNKDLLKHFGILELPSDPKDRLDAYRGAHDLEVWLAPDTASIQREYKAMRVFDSNEAEHSAYALQDIFLDEPRHPWLPEEDGDQRWLPVRMLQLVRKLPQDEWLSPPLVDSPRKRYEWDIRPDCAYHVSLQAFQSGFRPSVRKHVSIVQKRAFCPYLTIEFKRDEETLATARHQVAVASAMALYNRYRLKDCALQMSGGNWLEQDMNQMRHYGITFTGSTWDLWCTVPKTFETWTGCSMSAIYSGDCCILAGVEKLTSTINDIHYWGLMVHGKSCKADIAAKIHSDPDADTNDITLLEENS